MNNLNYHLKHQIKAFLGTNLRITMHKPHKEIENIFSFKIN